MVVQFGFIWGELRQLATDIDRLDRELRGTLEFRPFEGDLELDLSGDGKGHIFVTGRAGDIWDGNYVAFSFGIDQTDLPGIAQTLKDADPV